MIKIKRNFKLAAILTIAYTVTGFSANSAETEVKQPDWRWNARITHFSPTIYDTRNSLVSPENVEKRIKQIKDEGYTVVMLDGWHMWPSFQDKRDEWTKISKIRTETAHKYGLKVISHFDVPCIVYAGSAYELMLKHTDWLVRDIKYGEPAWMFCINNPEFRKFFFSFLEKYAKETGLDGVMLDECTFGTKEFCGCKYCRAKFTKATGEKLPHNEASDVFFNYDSKLWNKWLTWRQKSVAEWSTAVNECLKKARPENPPITMMYTTHRGMDSRWAPHVQGFDIFEVAKNANFIGTEIMSRNVLDGYRSLFAFRKIKGAIGRRTGSPVYGFIYHTGNKDFAYFGWGLLHMNNQLPISKTIPGENMKRYTDWEFQMKKDKASSLADTAILFSRHSRDFGRLLHHRNDSVGTSEALSDAHIMHDVLLDEDINLKTLQKYKLLILPSVMCMDKKQVAAVKKYVKNGGRLLASGNTSLFDEYGFGNDHFQLKELFGADYVKDKMTPKPTSIKGANIANPIEYPATTIEIKSIPDSKAKVLAELFDKAGKKVCPAIITNDYGKGKVIYSPCVLGAVNFEPELRVGQTWNYLRKDDLYKLLISQVDQLLTNPDFKAIAMPERVLATVYQQDTPGKPILVHLLNATGYKMKPGKRFAATHFSTAFPKMTEDIVFQIKLPAELKEAYIVSPDFAEKKPVKTEKIKDGFLKVTVNKDDLKTYSTIFFFCK